MPEAARLANKIGRKHDLPIVSLGHSGDHNPRPSVRFDDRDQGQRAWLEGAGGETFAAAEDLGESLSGEHGVGVLRRPSLEQALGPASIEMRERIR